jgi:hypothetical protein
VAVTCGHLGSFPDTGVSEREEMLTSQDKNTVSATRRRHFGTSKRSNDAGDLVVQMGCAESEVEH